MPYLRNSKDKKKSKERVRVIKAARVLVDDLANDITECKKELAILNVAQDEAILNYLHLSGWETIDGQLCYEHYKFVSRYKAIAFHMKTIVGEEGER